MNGFGNQFFPGPGFSGNGNGDIGFDPFFNQVKYFFYGRTLTYNAFFKVIFLSDFLFEAGADDDESAMQ